MTLCNSGSSSRSNRSVVFLKIAVLKNFEMFTVQYMCWSLLVNDVAGCIPKPLLKRYSDDGYSDTPMKYTACGF